MRKTEIDFLAELEQRVIKERNVLATQIMPAWARGLGEWFAVNPWRVLIPFSAFIYLVMRGVYGSRLVHTTLALFGGF